jgi:predicted nucleic acid-binding protein
LWDLVGDTLATLNARGLTVPFADAVVATLGIEHDIEVWARDAHFSAMQKILPQLKLFPEPP